jgi:hypothetical protein
MLPKEFSRFLTERARSRNGISRKCNGIARPSIAVFRQKFSGEPNLPEVFADVGSPALVRIVISVGLMLPNNIPFTAGEPKRLTNSRSFIKGALNFAMDMEPVSFSFFQHKMEFRHLSEDRSEMMDDSIVKPAGRV